MPKNKLYAVCDDEFRGVKGVREIAVEYELANYVSRRKISNIKIKGVKIRLVEQNGQKYI